MVVIRLASIPTVWDTRTVVVPPLMRSWRGARASSLRALRCVRAWTAGVASYVPRTWVRNKEGWNTKKVPAPDQGHNELYW